MVIKDIGKKLTESLHDAADTLKTKTETVQMPDFKEMGEKASQSVKAAFQKKKEKSDETEEVGAKYIPAVSVRNALKVIYYFMAADGTIFHGEEEKFDAIGSELLEDFAKAKENLVAECQSEMENVIDPEDHYDVIQDCVENALLSEPATEQTMISSKHLIWNLLSIAYSDEEYNSTEHRLLKYIVRKTNVDKAVFLEMESSILSFMAIEKERSWIKTTDRPYLQIEEIVNELNKRQQSILDGVKDLIML